jgi:hypothetical protein
MPPFTLFLQSNKGGYIINDCLLALQAGYAPIKNYLCSKKTGGKYYQ